MRGRRRAADLPIDVPCGCPSFDSCSLLCAVAGVRVRDPGARERADVGLEREAPVTLRSTARARRSSPIGAPTARCVASSSGAPSTRPSPVTRRRGKCASSTTMPAAGASTTRRATGRRSGTAARRTTVRRSLLRRGLQGARRNLLGDPVVATAPAAARLRSLAARAYGLRAPPLALEQRARQDRGLHPLDVRRPVAGRLRALHVPRPADLRVRLDGRGQPEGPLRAERLHRHVQFGLRAGLEA